MYEYENNELETAENWKGLNLMEYTRGREKDSCGQEIHITARTREQQKG